MSTCPNNGIEIISWYGYEDEEDKELKNLMPFLKALVLNEEKDVRPILKYYRNNYQQYIQDFVMPDFENIPPSNIQAQKAVEDGKDQAA